MDKSPDGQDDQNDRNDRDRDDSPRSDHHFKPRRVAFKKSNRRPVDLYKADGVRRRNSGFNKDQFFKNVPYSHQRIHPRIPRECFFQGRPPYDAFRNNRTGLPPSKNNWYRISIIQGQKFSRDFVLDKLLKFIAPLNFMPVMYHTTETDAVFFTEDHGVASKIASSDRRISADDFRVQIRVKPGTPFFKNDENLKDRLSSVLSKRYSQEKNSLDLSRFYNDTDLATDYWCPVNNPNIFTTLFEIAEPHLLNLRALSLESNDMMNVKNLGMFVDKLPNLKILHLGDNRIRFIDCLNLIKDLPLEELVLKGNPVFNYFKNRSNEYVKLIKRIFPNLLKLDGEDLPPSIEFDLDDQKRELPPTQRLFVVESGVHQLVNQFLEQYFTIFDSENRQLLLDAYHEQAYFSMSATVSKKSTKFASHLEQNRNLLKVRETKQRKKLLKQGRLHIASFISDLPRTKHDLGSFTMDISLVTEEFILITTTGFFTEFCSEESKEFLRYFNRTFTLMPMGGGFCISNEQLHISNPTLKQEKKSDPALPIPETSSVVTPEPQVKEEMVVTLSKQTNMNVDFSLKCLEEMQWNFDNAYAAFQEALSTGRIPSEAFVK